MPDKSLQRHSLVLQSAGTSSGEASAWARELAEAIGWAEERVYALDLCIVELVSNIVDHGYRGTRGEIRIELHFASATPVQAEVHSAVLTIIDEAPEFDPLSVPPPANPATLDEATIGGYGIHLVRSTADVCRYERREGRNVFTAYFGRISSPA